MKINDIEFTADLMDILLELISQLRANNIQLLQKYKEGPTHVQVCCPYHANGMERRPSAGIRKEDGMFHCFACNEVHSLPEMISHCFGKYDDIVGTFGWNWLLKNFATVRVEERKDVELDFTRNSNISFSTLGDSNISGQHSFKHKQCESQVGGDSRYITEEELDKYRYIHPYMYKRGLTDDIITLFDIGYDCDTNCITFPIRDMQGRVLFLARRSVNSKYFNYPSGVVKPLYGLYELNKCHNEYKLYVYDEDIIVTESMLDALSFWTIGKYAVALNGLGNELQFKQLRELPCRKLILATDMDDAGLRARERIKDNMNNTKIIQEYYFPEGRKDANECTKEELLNLEATF